MIKCKCGSEKFVNRAGMGFLIRTCQECGNEWPSLQDHLQVEEKQDAPKEETETKKKPAPKRRPRKKAE